MEPFTGEENCAANPGMILIYSMAERTMRTIKRYANRKLYDTQESRYVTLEQIALMIRQGEDVKVVDNNSKEDLTSVTLAQIIFEEEKKQRSFLPLSTLRNIIQSGGDSLQDLMSQLSEGAERVGRVFHSKEEEALAASQGQGQVEGEESSAQPEVTAEAESMQASFFRDFRDGFTGAMDEWQRRLDQSVTSAVESVSPLAPLQKEVQTLRDRLAEMEEKLKSIEN